MLNARCLAPRHGMAVGELAGLGSYQVVVLTLDSSRVGQAALLMQ